MYCRTEKGMSSALVGGLVLLIGIMAMILDRAVAQSATSTRDQIRSLASDMNAAKKLIASKKFRAAGERIKSALTTLPKISPGKSKTYRRALNILKQRVRDAHTQLTLEGIKLPPFALDPPRKPVKPKGTPNVPGAKTVGVLFSKDIVPMLVGKCAKCHIDDNKGKFSMANFAALKKGSKDGVVMTPGNGKDSRMVQLIVEGDMPRGDAKVTKEELAKLIAWIDGGAKFDGNNPTMALRQIATRVRRDSFPKLKVVQATGLEKSSYARDVASMFVRHCANCHGPDRPLGNLSMATFDRFLRGGDSGPIVVPGKPAESLLIKKLKGLAGDKMPLRLPAVPSEAITAVERWIADGAKFDGAKYSEQGSKTDTARLYALYSAKHADHDQLSKRRATKALVHWRLALPGSKPNIAKTKDFLLYGKIDLAQLKELGVRAERQADKVAKLLKTPADQPLIKGRLVFYVFDRRYHYTEFGQMVEKRGIPRQWRGHWNHDGVDAYACLLLEKSGDSSLDALMSGQMAGAYVASLGTNIPRWFSEGSARAISAKIAPRDEQVRMWNDSIGPYFKSSPTSGAFLAGKLPPENADVLSYSFVKHLMKNSRRYQTLLQRLRDGQPFEKAFLSAYRASPVQLLPAWSRTAARGK